MGKLAKVYEKILVLMDVDMPVMDGITATKEIIKWKGSQRCVVEIVGVTAFNTNEELQNCIDSGMTKAYTKPITIMLLSQCIERIFGCECIN